MRTFWANKYISAVDWFNEDFDYWHEADDDDYDHQNLEAIEEEFVQKEARRKKKLYEMFANYY